MASSNTFVTAGDITEAQSFTNFVFAPVEETNELAGEHTYSIIDDPEKGDTLVHITPMQIEGQSQNIINETVGPNDNNFQDRVTSTLVQEGVNVELIESGQSGVLLGEETYYVIEDGSLVVAGPQENDIELLPLVGARKRKAKSYCISNNIIGSKCFQIPPDAVSDIQHYMCYKCGERFVDPTVFRQHLLRSSSCIRPFRCLHCMKSFVSTKQLARHQNGIPKRISSVIKQNDAESKSGKDCKQCNQSFETRLLLQSHMESGLCGTSRVIHSSFMCHMCKKTYKILTSLEKHLGTHEQIDCPVCGMKFGSFQMYKDHVALHTKEEIARFRSESDKKRRLKQSKKKSVNEDGSAKDEGDYSDDDYRFTTAPKMFQCDECDKSFARQTDLDKHKYSHTGVAPWVCRKCGKSFLSSVKYKEHCLSHGSYTRPFHCSFCQKGFSNPEGLRAHERAHKGIRPFVCNTCGKTFTQKGNLKDHVLIHSDDRPWKCNVCDKGFRIKGDLTKHLVVHTGEKNYSCQYCDLKFSRASYLTRHTRTHTGEKPYVCDICNKAFSRSENCMEHRRIHTGERPYVCHCGATFKDSGNFCNHKKIHDPNHPKRKRGKRADDFLGHELDAHNLVKEEQLVNVSISQNMPTGSVIQVLPSSLFDRPVPDNMQVDTSGQEGMVSVRLLEDGQVNTMADVNAQMDATSSVVPGCVPGQDNYVMHIGNLLGSIEAASHAGQIDQCTNQDQFVTLSINDVRLLNLLQQSADQQNHQLQIAVNGAVNGETVEQMDGVVMHARDGLDEKMVHDYSIA